MWNKQFIWGYAKADASTRYQSKYVYMRERGHGENLLGSDFKS